MEIKVTNTDWRTAKVAIKDKTIIQRYLPKRIPTSLCMYRKAAKI